LLEQRTSCVVAEGAIDSLGVQQGASYELLLGLLPNLPSDATPEEQGDVEEGTTKGGRHFVRVHGTKEQTQAIARLREKQGHHPSDVKQDQKDLGVWYFYLDQQEKSAD
jgi:hypothetical protein